jgi:Protein of unknown function (DUF1761)
MDPAQVFANINWLAVVVAALAAFPIGMLWYGPLFRSAWMAATGVTFEQGKQANPLKLCGTVFVLNFIIAISLAMFIGNGDVNAGLFAGFMAGATFVATAIGVVSVFEFKSFKYWAINAGYQIVFFTVAGAIIGAWH